jgi:hypothetical protein
VLVGTAVVSFLSPLTGIFILYPQNHIALFTSASILFSFGSQSIRYLFAFLQCLSCLLLTWLLYRKTIQAIARLD